MSFNPDADQVLGLEWFGARSRSAQIDSSTNAIAAVFDSTATEDIQELRIFLGSVVGNGVWEVEIYDADDADPGDTVVNDHPPDEDVRIVYARDTLNAEAPGTLYTLVDEGDPVNESDFIQFFAGNLLYPFFGLYGARYASIAGAYAGAPIEKVTLSMWARSFSGVDGFAPVLNANLYAQVNDGPVQIGPKLALTTEWDRFEWELPYNPVTGASWKVADVEFLDTGGTTGSSAGAFAASTGSVNFTQHIAELHVTVTAGTTEKRLAVGRLTNPIVGWNAIPMRALTDAIADWGKASGTTYMIVLRRRSGTGRVSWSGIDAQVNVCPNAGWRSFKPGFNSDGQLGPGGVPDNADSTAYAITMITDGAAVSDDSQPYAQLRQGVVSNLLSSEVRQYFTTGAGDDYGAVAVLIRAIAGPPNDEQLVVELRTTGDAVLGTATFEQSDILAPPVTSFQIARFSIPATPLAGGTTYYLAFAPPATTNAVGSAGYEVMILTGANDYATNDIESQGADVTFGGTDGAWTSALNAQDVDADLAATIAVIPDTPAGFAAVLSSVGLSNYEAPCSIEQMTTVTLTWGNVTGTQYELQWLDGHNVWRTIAILPNETAGFTDHQAPLGLDASYRVRAFTDFAASEWSAIATVTMPSDLSFAGVILTSNQQPALSVAYSYIQIDEGLEREYHFPNGESAIVARLYGRDAQVVFDELEDRKTVFPLTLLISGALTAPLPLPGPRVFDAALAICRAPVDSVVVKDMDGNVYYANVLPTDARRREKGSTYELDVTVTEVSTVPPIALTGILD